MRFDKWITENNDKLIQTCLNITKSDDYMDIHQIVVLSLLERIDVLNNIPDKQRLFYYIGAVRRQYFSDSSKYYKMYKQLEKSSISVIDDIFAYDDTYNEGFTFDFVFEQLDKMSWFDKDLFMMYIELKTIKAVSEQTTIPFNSVSKYIKRIKKQILKNYKNR